MGLGLTRSIFLLIGGITSVLADFEQVHPILWLDTGIPVSLGQMRQSIDIPIPVVCPDLILHGLDNFRDWCRMKREEYLLKPLEDLCNPHSTQIPSRYLRRYRRKSNSSSSTSKRKLGVELDGLKVDVKELRLQGDRLNTSNLELQTTVENATKIQGEHTARIRKLESKVSSAEDWRTAVTSNAEKLLNISAYFSSLPGRKSILDIYVYSNIAIVTCKGSTYKGIQLEGRGIRGPGRSTCELYESRITYRGMGDTRIWEVSVEGGNFELY
jgi:hypothetical protein